MSIAPPPFYPSSLVIGAVAGGACAVLEPGHLDNGAFLAVRNVLASACTCMVLLV